MISVMATRNQKGFPDGADDRRWMVWLSVASIVLALIGIGVPLVVSGAITLPTYSGQPPAAQDDLGLAVLAAALVVGVIGLVRMAQAGMLAVDTRVRVPPCTRRERAQTLRRVHRGEPMSAEAMPLAVALAHSTIRRSRSGLLSLAIALLMVGMTLLARASWWMVPIAVAVAWTVISAGIDRRDARRAQRWLDVHQQPVTSEAADL